MLRDSLIGIAAAIVVLVMVYGSVFAFNWHCAGVEAEYYQSRGVDITQRDIFWGVDPKLSFPAKNGCILR